MENAVWLLAVAGGAVALAIAIAFVMLKQDPQSFGIAFAGVVVVAVAAVGIGFIVSQETSTAPSNPPDPQGSHYDGPARPSDENALPGTATPADNN